MSKFKSGDIVQLNTGGPIMNVNRVFSSEDRHIQFRNTVDCQWFSGTNLKNGNFHIDTLKRVEEGKNADA